MIERNIFPSELDTHTFHRGVCAQSVGSVEGKNTPGQLIDQSRNGQCATARLDVYLLWLTPSLPQPVNFRAERCTDTPTNSIFSGPITHLFSMQCVLMKILSHAGAKKKTKRLTILHFCWSFSSDIVAVKGSITLDKYSFVRCILRQPFKCRRLG